MLQKILFSNFLGQGRQGSASLNELLDKPDNLPRLMDDDSFISQFKAGSNRIRQYMTYDRFVELTEYVTVVGQDENDKKRGYKFPQTAAELLTSDNSKVEEYFLPTSGVVNYDEKITKSIEKEVEQEVQDDGDEEETDGGNKQQKKQTKQGEEGDVQGETKAKEGEGEDQEFGDFVEAKQKKKKTVKVKEVVDIIQTVKHEKEPLINQLLDYFNKPINYTLTGYVSKILVSLLNRRTQTFLSKVFDKAGQSQTLFDNIFAHLGSRSTVDLLVRIFTIESKSYIEERYHLFVRMIAYLTKATELDSLANITACVAQVYEKMALHLKTVNPIKELNIYQNKIPELLQKLNQLFLGENFNASRYSAIVICQLLGIFNVKDQSDQIDDFLNKYLQGATKTLQKYEEQGQKRLGFAPVKIVESLVICLKSWRVNQYLKNDQQLYPTVLKLATKYPLNNIFHNEVFKLLTLSLSSPIPQLIQNVIESTDLTQWLQTEAKKGSRIQQNQRKDFQRGYGGHLYHLCRFLKQTVNKHPSIVKVLEDERFEFIVKVLLDDEHTCEEQMLGGLSKKQTKHKVLHSMKDILEQHKQFLSWSPSPVYEQDLQDPTLNPILLEQLQKQLDGIQMQPPQDVPQAVVEEEKHKAELIEENDHHKNAFWKVHLDYDVDGLIDDLL